MGYSERTDFRKEIKVVLIVSRPLRIRQLIIITTQSSLIPSLPSQLHSFSPNTTQSSPIQPTGRDWTELAWPEMELDRIGLAGLDWMARDRTARFGTVRRSWQGSLALASSGTARGPEAGVFRSPDLSSHVLCIEPARARGHLYRCKNRGR